MKVYRVVFDPGAQAEALEAAEFISHSSPANAVKWFAGLEQVVKSLSTMPHRCGTARKSSALRIEERWKIVRILHIRHAARRPFDQEGV